MIPRRPRLWWGYSIGSAVLLAALGWASVSVYRLEARGAEARALAQRQEVIRRALWRVDSQLAPIIAMEAARPIGARSVVPNAWASDGFTETADPSARLLLSDQPAIGLNLFNNGFFEIGPEGEVNATDPLTNDAAEAYGRRQFIQEEAELASAEGAEREQRAGRTDEPEPGVLGAAAAEESAEPGRQTESLSFDYAARQQVANIAKQSDQGVPARRERPDEPAAPLDQASFSDASPGPARAREASSESDRLGDAAVLESPSRFRPGETPAGIEAVWVTPGGALEPELLLVRPADGPGTRAQGVRLDWPALRAMLEDSVGDLLPATTLVPVRSDAMAQERAGRAYRLATIPALLVPGGAIAIEEERMTPAFWALLVTWIATLVALVAVASVLHATLRLSDRRARFVGAVTHELRTPLTTFRLYAQMLAGGMVTDESARAEYLGTLERESVRLGEIVENVLEYARLTRRRPGDARPPGERSVSPSELVARVRPVLSRRAEQSGMDLIVSIAPSAEPGAARTATCDPRSVERILMNLVENACKYAGPPEDAPDDETDTRVHLDVSATDRALEILVADHGPGVPSRQRERVFGEFQRGPGAAESSRPGLGLGLALSRGLAREMGGDLRLVRRRGHGAEFLLTVPLDPAAAPAEPAG